MKRIYALFLALAIAAVAVSASYMRATGGSVEINGDSVRGDNSPFPTVKMSSWDNERGNLMIQGEFAGEDDFSSNGDNDKVSLNLRIWDDGESMVADGWYWRQGNSPVRVFFSDVEMSLDDGSVDISGSNGLVSFEVRGMDVETPEFLRPLPHF